MKCRVNHRTFEATIWDHTKPFPLLGTLVGVDTLTTLIDENNSVPDLAYLGVYDPASNTAYIVRHTDAILFMLHLCLLNIIQYYFNAAFDFLVLLKKCQTELQAAKLFTAADTGHIIDAGVRAQLRCLATVGFVLSYTYSLKGLARSILHYNMDKGLLQGEQADRLTFSPDKLITQSQTAYLGIDCFCTYYCAAGIQKMPTEILHTLGSIVLGCILHNGLNLDLRVWKYFLDKLIELKDRYRLVLVGYGFPDPLRSRESVAQITLARFKLAYLTFMSLFIATRLLVPVYLTLINKAQVMRMLVYLLNIDMDLVPLVFHNIRIQNKGLSKLLKTKFLLLCLKYDIGFYAAHSKNFLLRFILAVVLLRVYLNLTMLLGMLAATTLLDMHLLWYILTLPVGPKKFMQLHLARLKTLHPKLLLPMTPKSGLLKMTKDDLWRLDDLGINDPFLKAYISYGHARKYLNTYLNRLFIRPDGKIHPRYTNILRTGRTSCKEPNVQNLPSRDKVYALKNMYCPPPGAILCATDFSFVLLCAFAQACYTRFGASTMKDIINAGVDPHRWFAGVMYKVIGADTDKLVDPTYAKLLNAMLKQNVTDSQRQLAKIWPFIERSMSNKKVNCWKGCVIAA